MGTTSDALRDVLWSLWAELGVPGWTRNHQDWWMDPEVLVLVTAVFADLDARLREEASEWIVRYAHLLSGSRMKNLLRKAPRLAKGLSRPHAVDFLARIQAHTQLRLPVEAKGNLLELRRTKAPLDVSRPAHLSLRLRAILGVGARAEVVRFFLLGKAPWYSARQLVDEDLGFTKRTVQLVLEDLVLTDVLGRKRRGHTDLYRLVSPEVLALGGPLSPYAPRWLPLWEVMLGLHDIEAEDSRKSSTRALTLRTQARKLDLAVEEADLPPIPHHVKGNDFLDAFSTWAQGIFDDLVAGKSPERQLLKRGA